MRSIGFGFSLLTGIISVAQELEEIVDPVVTNFVAPGITGCSGGRSRSSDFGEFGCTFVFGH
jgi:hypothetical protein